MERLYNQKGQPFRPSLFHFQGHLYPEQYGATPDGRRASDYQNIIVRVTGYAARFISLPRIYQEEFVSRMNYGLV